MPDNTKEASTTALRRFVFLAQWRFSETLAFAFVSLLGVVVLAIHLSTWGADARRDAKFSARVPCTVEKPVARAKIDKRGVARFRPEVAIRYVYEGESYSTIAYDSTTLTEDQGFVYDEKEAKRALAPYYRGRQTSCWIRVDDPSQATLVKKSNVWGWIFLIVPTLLILFGGSLLAARLYDALFSAEAKAGAKRARSLVYPTVPPFKTANAAVNGGQFVELPPNEPASFAFWSAAFGAVAWNAACWSIFLYALLDARKTWERVAAGAFCLVFCGVGLIFACRLWIRWRRERAVGKVRLAVAFFPTTPGRKLKCRLYFNRALSAKRVSARLVCEEIARFAQGVDAKAVRREIYSQPIYTEYEAELRDAARDYREFVAIVPIGAMHSFRAEHNEITWKIVAMMEFADGGTFARSFEIIVLPFAPKE